MEWTRPEVISAAALAVSGLSLAVSAFVAWRAITADQPRVWLALEPTEASDCWIGKIHVQCGPRVGLAGRTVRTAAISVANARHQPILFGPHQGVVIEDEHGRARLPENYASRCNALMLPIYDEPTSTVRTGEHGIIPFLVYRPALSRSERVTVIIAFRSLSGRQPIRTFKVRCEIPTGGIGFALG